MFEFKHIESVSFFEAVTDTTGGNAKVQRASYLNFGCLPVIDQGQSEIAGYTNDLTLAYEGRLPVVLFGDHTRAFKYVDFPFALGADGVKVLEPKIGFEADFLYYYFRSLEIPSAGYSRHFKFLKEVSVRKLPLPEQRRIVDILSRAEGIVRLRREAEKKAAELIPALFIEMFGDPAVNPKALPLVQLGELLEDGPQNGLYKHSSHYGDGTPILRIDAFYDGRVRDMESLKRVRVSEDERNKFRLNSRDIVINRVNSVEYLGKSAIIPVLVEPTVFESNMMRMTLNEGRVLPEFLIELLQTAYAKRHFLANAKHAINQSSINQQDVKTIAVPLPPLELQHQFAQRVEAIRALQTQQAAATAKAQASFDALLAQAFPA